MREHKASAATASRVRCVGALVVIMLMTACGGSSESNSAKPSPRPSSGVPDSSEPRAYFERADSKVVNRALQAAHRAIMSANGPEAEACNAIGDSEGFGPWRNCLHDVLDPVVEALADLASNITGLARDELGSRCNGELEKAGSFYDKHQRKVSMLLRGFDSDDTTAQRRSARAYRVVIGELSRNLGAPLDEITRACLAPEVLESLSRSPESRS